MTSVAFVIIQVVAFVPAIVLHEMSHGFAAYKLGDATAKRAGRLSLNPLKHIDPFGTVVLPLLLLALNMPVFGYAKPVPYDPRSFKNPRRDELVVGLAGPASNLALAVIGALLARCAMVWYGGSASGAAGMAPYYLVLFFRVFCLINLYLAFFNILPIPPLDGSSIFAILVPRRHMATYYRVQQYAFPIFMIALIVLPQIAHVDPIGWYLQVTAGNLYHLLLGR